MTLLELLAEIQEKYPHTLSDVSIVRKLDALQKRIFRTFKKMKASSAPLIAGQGLYTTPLRAADIVDVLVNGKSYPYRHLNELPISNYYFYLENKIGIVPIPTEDGTLQVFHFTQPDTLDANTLNQVPELDEDYHNILVYGVCKEIAENYHDFDIANGFALQYNTFMDELLKYHQPVEPYTIREVW